MPLKTRSPAATSCSGVTLAPSVSACGTSDCTCGILLAMSVYSPSVPRTTPRMRRLMRHIRRLFGEPAEPEDERHERQEDEDAGADHDGGVAQRRRRRVAARVLHHLPYVPVL